MGYIARTLKSALLGATLLMGNPNTPLHAQPGIGGLSPAGTAAQNTLDLHKTVAGGFINVMQGKETGGMLDSFVGKEAYKTGAQPVEQSEPTQANQELAAAIHENNKEKFGTLAEMPKAMMESFLAHTTVNFVGNDGMEM